MIKISAKDIVHTHARVSVMLTVNVCGRLLKGPVLLRPLSYQVFLLPNAPAANLQFVLVYFQVAPINVVHELMVHASRKGMPNVISL